jgi:glucose/arabinose dehydrogenase
MTSRVRWLFALSASLVFLCILFPSTNTTAHPAWNPYDGTRFAPILSFGPDVGVEVVADGMTSPLKAIHAPGQPNFLYVVDQPGRIWQVNLGAPLPNKTLFLDVTALIGPLGVCGPNTFDERGLLGLAFHPDFNKPGRPGFGKFYTYTSEQTVGAPTFPTSPTGTFPDHDNVIREWQAPLPVTPAVPGRELMRVTWPQFNHDGGDLAFGPDGNLYISMGDGGAADDADGEPFILAQPRYPQTPNCTLVEPSSGHQVNGNAQKLNTPLGKILRINVNCGPGTGVNCTPGKQYRVPADNPFVGTPGAIPEIYAFGFRNPYRMSFDLKRVGAVKIGERGLPPGDTPRDDLYLGDVGQNDLEEVDIVEKGGNYGWNCKEGTKYFHINGPAPGTAEDEPRPGCEPRDQPIPFRDPIAQFDTHHEGHSVIGGYVYRGHRIPQLFGRYIFAEFSSLFKFPSGPHDYGRLFTIGAGGHGGHLDLGRGDRENDQGRGGGLRRVSELMVLPGSKVWLAVLGIGQDAQGEIYITGNVSGVPFPDLAPQGTGSESPPLPRLEVFNGRVLRLVPPPAPVTDAE